MDTDLIAKAKAGDQKSFCDLYEAVAPNLYRTALYTLGNSHDAEDVVAETFVEAINCIKKLRDNSAFNAWIFKILSIRCKRKMKEYTHRRQQFDIDEIAEIADENDLSKDVTQRADLLKALSKLTASEREIVFLASVEGYTTKEISQILGCPHGTVSSKLFRSLKKLRNLIEG